MLDATQGFPGIVSLEGVQLTTDDAVVTVEANKALTLSWTLASSGPIDMTSVVLYEVIVQNGATTLRPLRAYKTTERSIRIVPGMLLAGSSYIVRLDANIGLVNAATGDLRTVQYPYSNATQWSHVFGINEL